MKFLPEKFNSDRLWAIVAYGLLLVANARMGLGIDPEAMTELSYVVIAFVLGKSVRGTGNALSALLPAAFATQAAPEIDSNPLKLLREQLQEQLKPPLASAPTQPPVSKRVAED